MNIKRRKTLDLDGKIFGDLTVISRIDDKTIKYSGTVFKCRCKCGKIVVVKGAALNNGNNRSCGYGCPIKSKIGLRVGSCLILNEKISKNNFGAQIYVWRCDCGRIVNKTLSAMQQLENNCGNGCSLLYQSYLNKKINNLTIISFNKKNNRGMFTCLCDCGITKEIASRHLLSNKVQSCGCKRKGSNSHFFIKNKSQYHVYSFRNSSADHIWAKEIKKRDNHTCQICGFFNKKDENLVAHHLDSYIENINSRTDPNNGITLCQKCHYSFHGKYGQITRRIQFLEFILLIHNCDWPVSLHSKYLNNKKAVEKDYLESI